MRVCDSFDVKCPKCGDDQKIEVAAIVWARFTEDGTDTSEPDDSSHEYDNGSAAACRACGHSAPFSEFSCDAI
jgi:hypothetical protein